MRHRPNPGDEDLRRRQRISRASPHDPVDAVPYARSLERRGKYREAARALKRAGMIVESSLLMWQYDLQRTAWYRSERGSSELSTIPEDETPHGAAAYLDTTDVFYYDPATKLQREATKRFGIMGHGHELMQAVVACSHETTCEIQVSPDGHVREYIPHDPGAYAFMLDFTLNPLLTEFAKRYYGGPVTTEQTGFFAWMELNTTGADQDLVFVLDTHWLLGWPIRGVPTFRRDEEYIGSAGAPEEWQGVYTGGYVQCPCCGMDTIAVPCHDCELAGCEPDEPRCAEDTDG